MSKTPALVPVFPPVPVTVKVPVSVETQAEAMFTPWEALAVERLVPLSVIPLVAPIGLATEKRTPFEAVFEAPEIPDKVTEPELVLRGLVNKIP